MEISGSQRALSSVNSGSRALYELILREGLFCQLAFSCLCPCKNEWPILLARQISKSNGSMSRNEIAYFAHNSRAALKYVASPTHPLVAFPFMKPTEAGSRLVGASISACLLAYPGLERGKRFLGCSKIGERRRSESSNSSRKHLDRKGRQKYRDRSRVSKQLQ